MDPEAPLFPTEQGTAPSKAAVVATFPKIGEQCEQPLMSAAGLRLFGGHTARITGSQVLAAIGLEINKIRLLARQSGDTILRYVSEAPLKSLKSDLWLEPAMAAPTFASSGSSSTAPLIRRITGLEEMVARLEATIAAHASAMRAKAPEPQDVGDDQQYIQNKSTSAVHLSRIVDKHQALCGWVFRGPANRHKPIAAIGSRDARRKYRVLERIDELPSQLICERCLPSEHASAAARGLITDDLSGDEGDVIVDDQQ